MGYNSHCNYQNCTWKCCNYNGDCPEWYFNGNLNYTSCHYYYEVDPTLLLWTTIATAIGAVILIILSCACYKQYKKKQEELRKQNGQFQISNATLQTKADVVVLGRSNTAVILTNPPQSLQKKSTTPLVPYGQPLNISQFQKTTDQIYGIGASNQI